MARAIAICGGFLALHDAPRPPRGVGGARRPPAALVLRRRQRRYRRRGPGARPPYSEDSTADVDMNVVTIRPIAGGDTRFVEVQGTAEGVAQPLRTAWRCSTWPSAGSPRSWISAEMIAEPPAPAGGDRLGHRRLRQLVCVGEPVEGRRDRGHRRWGDRVVALPVGNPGLGRGRWNARRQRPSGRPRRSPRRAACPASPTTPVPRYATGRPARSRHGDVRRIRSL